MARRPAEHLARPPGARHEPRRVAGPPAGRCRGNRAAGDAPGRLHHLPVREAGPVAEIERARFDAVDAVEREQVRVGDVRDVDVVADAGAVRGVVVAAEDPDLGAQAERHLQQDRDQVRFGHVVFAALRRRPAGVEVAERDVAQAVRRRVPRQRPLERQLRGAVGVDRPQRRVLGDRGPLRLAVDRGGRRKDQTPHVGGPHGVQQVEAAGYVDLEELRRFGRRLADQRLGRQVRHRVRAHRGHHLREPGAIAQVALEERRPGRHGRAMPVREIVERGDRVAVREQALGHHAADVSGRAGDENCHGWSGQSTRGARSGSGRESRYY